MKRPEAARQKALGKQPCAGMGAYIKTQGLEAKTLLEESALPVGVYAYQLRYAWQAQHAERQVHRRGTVTLVR